jgi:hypothetical protein
MAPDGLSDFVLQAAKQNGAAILEEMIRWFRYTETCRPVVGPAAGRAGKRNGRKLGGCPTSGRAYNIQPIGNAAAVDDRRCRPSRWLGGNDMIGVGEPELFGRTHA